MLANSPAPAALPIPYPCTKPCMVDLEDVLQVLKREKVKPEVILAVKELELEQGAYV